MFSFHVEADLAILFEQLTAQIGARPGFVSRLPVIFRLILVTSTFMPRLWSSFRFA